MSTTTSLPETTAKHLSVEGMPVFANESEHVQAMDGPPLKEEPLLAPPAKETTPGRALLPNEALPSDLPLVLVRGAEQGKVEVLPGYYACVGTMPCAATEYYLLVRWEHREGGRQGERRVVLPEHIRVLDPAVVLFPSPHAISLRHVAASGAAAAVSEELGSLTPEATTSTKNTGQPSNEHYPQLQHSAKRKSY